MKRAQESTRTPLVKKNGKTGGGEKSRRRKVHLSGGEMGGGEKSGGETSGGELVAAKSPAAKWAAAKSHGGEKSRNQMNTPVTLYLSLK